LGSLSGAPAWWEPKRVTTPAGEGATSLGTMVPVHTARAATEARLVVEILEGHAIPAVVDRDLALYVPQTDGAQVLVPSSQLGQAILILRSHDLPTAGPALVVPELLEPEEPPLLQPLPEPAPASGRLSVALLAIGGGVLGQRLLEVALAPGRVSARFGARMPIFEQPWRLITGGFLHSGIDHMVSNALFGLLIGVVLFGTHLYGGTMVAWLIASIAGLGLECLMSPEATVIGASAGNYGLVGLWVHGQLERSRIVTLPRREQLRTVGVVMLLVPGALTPFSSTGSRIAVLAHVVGFVAGFFVGTWFPRRLDPSGFPKIERRNRVGLGIATTLVGLGILGATLYG
jgi:membrane associated rhomboid family serine protease